MIMQKKRRNLFGGILKKRNIFINIRNYNYWIKKIIIKIIISAILLMVVTIIKTSNFEQPKKALNFIELKLGSGFNTKVYLAGIKKLPGYIFTLGDKVVTVMKIDNKLNRGFVSPIDGEIITYFDEKIEGKSSISKGLIFVSDIGQDIYSMADGVVIDTGSNKLIGNYIIIKHKGELLSVYKHVGTNYIDINQRVKQGQVIGVSSGELLLEVWYRNKPTDPIEYMDTSTQQL